LLPNRDPSYVNNDLWWLHGLFSLLLVIALVAGVVLVVRLYLRRPNLWTAHPPLRNPAIDELDLRYARGEIDRADYLQRRIDLTDRSGALPAPAQAPAKPPSKGGAAG
jgi:putative membrane protein